MRLLLTLALFAATIGFTFAQSKGSPDYISRTDWENVVVTTDDSESEGMIVAGQVTIKLTKRTVGSLSDLSPGDLRKLKRRAARLHAQVVVVGPKNFNNPNSLVFSGTAYRKSLK